MATRLRIWLLTLSTLLVSLVAVASPARADTCTQGTFGCPWTSGTFATHTQDDWGTAPALTTHFADVYPSNILDVGGSWLSGNGYYLEFYDPASVAGFLPMTTAPGPLTQYVYPPELTYYTAGRFGTNVTSLKLNVDFGARGYLAHPAGQNLTDLRICNTTGLPVSAGTSVGAVLFVASQMLANQAPYSNNDYTAWDTLVALLNAAFDNGLPSSWAKDHLRTGSCPNVSLSISSSGQPVAGGINRFVAHVTDAANGAPIANASVVLRLEPGSVNAPYGTSAPTNSSGDADFLLSGFQAGTDTMTFWADADNDFALDEGEPSVTGPVQWKFLTSTSVHVSPNPVEWGAPVTLSFTVTGGNPPPTGLLSVVDSAGGFWPTSVGTPLQISDLSIGSHAMHATYGGDSQHYASDVTFGVTVTRAATTLHASPASKMTKVFSATLTRTSTGAPLLGEPVTFSVPKRKGSPQLLCTAVTSATGVATCTATGKVSAKQYTASYGGSATYFGSAATAVIS